jgi:tripartite-type tricarboxylate transporter receptor subunit TctC
MFAQERWPSKPIKVVVPTGPGSSADIRARQIGDQLAKVLGKPVFIENRPGAGATIGADYVAKSPADGYTLLYGTIADQAIAPALYPSLPYNPRKDFVPIVQNALFPPQLVVNPALGVRSMKELIALAKAKPGQLMAGSWGNGSLTHLLVLQLNREAGIEISHVPYKNAASALSDVVGGHVSMMFDYIPATESLIKAGKLRPLMTVGSQRSKVLPDVPSAAEVGLPGIKHMGWSGFFAPAGTSKEIVARLHIELARIVRSPELAQIVVDSGGEVPATSSEEFAAFVRHEQDEMAEIVKSIGAKVN